MSNESPQWKVMNWIAFFVLAYAAMGLQTGLSAWLRFGSSGFWAAAPNFGLLAVVFLALNAQRQAALLGGFLIGALQDLATRQPFGLFAFSYGLAALAIASAAHSVHRQHPLTHFSCALLGGCITASVLLIHGQLYRTSWPGAGPLPLLGGALYTALLAPLLIGGLQRFNRLFAFKR
jgi:rod shape-determining protein MreD